LKSINIQKTDQLINEQIRAPKVQVITFEGGNAGVISRDEALRMARAAELDLVMVSDTGQEGVPVVKIMDFGKLLYAKKKKQAEAKKHQKTIQVKEIKMRPKIGEHDYLTKLKQAVGFLKDGKHVKITLMFRGREAATSKERGAELFERIDQTFAHEGLANLAHEKDMKSSSMWSRIYFVK
jgi:translation initiation factor IF-3